MIKGAVLYGYNEPLRVELVNVKPPREDEVVVKLVASGVCHTDLSVVQGKLPVPPPAILGHEGAGIVEEVGSADSPHHRRIENGGSDSVGERRQRRSVGHDQVRTADGERRLRMKTVHEQSLQLVQQDPQPNRSQQRCGCVKAEQPAVGRA